MPSTKYSVFKTLPKESKLPSKFLNFITDVLAIILKFFNPASLFKTSSCIPSVKYKFSSLLLRFLKGRIAMEVLVSCVDEIGVTISFVYDLDEIFVTNKIITIIDRAIMVIVVSLLPVFVEMLESFLISSVFCRPCEVKS